MNNLQKLKETVLLKELNLSVVYWKAMQYKLWTKNFEPNRLLCKICENLQDGQKIKVSSSYLCQFKTEAHLVLQPKMHNFLLMGEPISLTASNSQI